MIHQIAGLSIQSNLHRCNYSQDQAKMTLLFSKLTGKNLQVSEQARDSQTSEPFFFEYQNYVLFEIEKESLITSFQLFLLFA